MASPFFNIPENKWQEITQELIKNHPLYNEIVPVVLKSWADIFNSNIGSFYIGKDIFPVPQIMSFFLHELVAHYLGLGHPGVYKVGTLKNEKDVHCILNTDLSVEIKASSHPNQIFANRSYAQPQAINAPKSKDGFYITINFEKFDDVDKRLPEILLIRFGYLEHSDWIAQASATGQQARLAPIVYSTKLITIYSHGQTIQEPPSAPSLF